MCPSQVSGTSQVPKVMFWHLAKSGGSTVRGLLKAALPANAQRSMHIVAENGTMDKSLWGSNWFRIGVTRDPCSYYKSLFLYGSTLNAGAFFHALKKERDGEVV